MTDNTNTPGLHYQPGVDPFSDLMDNMDGILAEMEDASQLAVAEGADAEFEYMVHADAASLTLKSGLYIEARIANLLRMSENSIFSTEIRRIAAKKAATMLGIQPGEVAE